MSEQTKRKPLSVEDVAVLLAIKAQVENHQAAISALEGVHNTLIENMRVRYDAPSHNGWRLNDYMAGFVHLPGQEHDSEHAHGHHGHSH